MAADLLESPFALLRRALLSLQPHIVFISVKLDFIALDDEYVLPLNAPMSVMYIVWPIDFVVEPSPLFNMNYIILPSPAISISWLKRTEKEIFNMHFAFRLLLRDGYAIDYISPCIVFHIH